MPNFKSWKRKMSFPKRLLQALEMVASRGLYLAKLLTTAEFLQHITSHAFQCMIGLDFVAECRNKNGTASAGPGTLTHHGVNQM